MRLVIDDERCQGHGRCYALQPALFDADDEGYPILLQEDVDGEQLEAARKAVTGCPERALSLVEAS